MQQKVERHPDSVLFDLSALIDFCQEKKKKKKKRSLRTALQQEQAIYDCRQKNL